MATLKLQNIHKVYGNKVVIPKIDLSINDGEFVCLVGPSGSGKSTLLRMVAGLESITSGSVFVNGEDITATDPSDRDMAMVFQNYALYPHMTVKENMGFALRMRGEAANLIDKRVAEAIEMLDLQGKETRKPAELSGGERQRVAMGRCIVRKPKLFLFDEPLSNLDAKLRTGTRHQIRKLHEKLGATSIFVTHDQVEAMTMADRIVLLNFGEIMQIGTPQELYLEPRNRFTAGFLGSPEMNFFEGILKTTSRGFILEGATRLHLKASKARQEVLSKIVESGCNVEIGVRPEHFTIYPPDTPETMSLPVVGMEWLGREAFVFGYTEAGREVSVRAATDETNQSKLTQPGDLINVSVISDSWHIFDPVDGCNILAKLKS
jgi:multiple sugar transport system ATP-binding protein